jgi:hypothetical protein
MMSMRTALRLSAIAAGLLIGGALLRRWLEEQPQTIAEPAAPAPVAAPLQSDLTTAMTRKQLYDRARELGIQGRSKMNKSQLAEAVRRAEPAG